METPERSGGMQERTDGELVRVLQSHHGDHSPEENDALRLLMQRLKPEVDAVLRHTNIGWHDLDEVEQEVFILMLTKIDQLRDPEALHGWVKQIARRTALNYRIRTKGKDNVQLGFDDEGRNDSWHPEIDLKDRPLERILHGEMEQKMLRALEQMPAVSRQRLRQFYLRDMSLEEIVQEGGGKEKLPLGTVKRQLFTARNRLREALQEA